MLVVKKNVGKTALERVSFMVGWKLDGWMDGYVFFFTFTLPPSGRYTRALRGQASLRAKKKNATKPFKRETSRGFTKTEY